MTTYLVFAGMSYYPSGGFKDLVQTDEPITSVEDALEVAANADEDWWQIVEVNLVAEDEYSDDYQSVYNPHFEIVKTGGQM